MTGRIIDWLRGTRRAVTPPAPEGTLLVIGDVHGRRDLLEQLLERLWNDTGVAHDARTRLVLVGDLVDRGPDSAGVIDMVRRLQSDGPWQVEALLGNHEAMLLDFLDASTSPAVGESSPDQEVAEIDTAARWLSHGGSETVESFGIACDPALDRAGLRALQAQLAGAIGADRIAWLRARPRLFRSGDTVVVHASYDPARPDGDQDETALIWGRRGFLKQRHAQPPWIVHGHTITRPAGVFGCRIAVDTGAYFSGELTCALLQAGHNPRLIATTPERSAT